MYNSLLNVIVKSRLPFGLEAELREQVVVRTGDDVAADEFANAVGSFRARFYGSLNATDIAFDDDCEETAADLDLLYDLYASSLAHCVACLDATDEALCFYGSD